jgi:hypothetical protein
VPLNPAMMRNRWFPMRLADYVPITQLKQLKAQSAAMGRDFGFGVAQPLLEDVEMEEEGGVIKQPKHYVRPIELDFLSVGAPSGQLNCPCADKASPSDLWNS